ncbi:MAG: DUF3108 domain-containing protein [Gemmatimonadetes bacterium]|nr:DUF3108 domain-containing protein [Gemmatimonadota bacterium]
MIYVCVPVHNEAKTVGLVLWKVRQVFTGFEREYHLLVGDDGSTDATAEVLATYARVLPMTVVTHRERQGYAKGLEELLRLALQRTDRPKRDCAITLHADFLHSPEAMEEMVKRLESGADMVVAELTGQQGDAPRALRWARAWAPLLLRVAGVKDTLSGFTALRLIVLKQALRHPSPAERSLLTTDGWCANAELLARLTPHARRLETIPTTARYDLRQRPSRVKPWDVLVQAWRARPVIRAARSATAALLLLVAPLFSQNDTARAEPPLPPPGGARAVRFAVGERMRYQAKFGLFNVGQATMEVAGIDTLRGIETVRFRFHIKGGALWYHLDQLMESWVGRDDFRSRRFRQQTEEKNKQRLREYDIYPDSGFYRETGRDTTFATIPDPLDEAAFLYWIRTVPLEVGKRYAYHRYFRAERNPVIVQVLGRERVSVAGRKFNAIVVRPIIPHGRGILAEKADARIWLSDDTQRLMLAMVSTFSFGTVTLKLKEYAAPAPEQP